MYKEILEALKKKFPGVSDAILGKTAKKLSETVKTAEEIDTAVEGVTFQTLLESYGDTRATEATKTAVTNYEKKYGLKDGVKVTNPTVEEPKTEHEEDVPAWAKTIIETNKALEKKVAQMAGEKITGERRQQLNEIIKVLPAELRKGYERIALDNMEDEAFNTLLQDVKTEVEGIQESVNAKGSAFGRPLSGSGSSVSKKEASDEELNDVVDGFNI